MPHTARFNQIEMTCSTEDCDEVLERDTSVVTPRCPACRAKYMTEKTREQRERQKKAKEATPFTPHCSECGEAVERRIVRKRYVCPECKARFRRERYHRKRAPQVKNDLCPFHKTRHINGNTCPMNGYF